MIRHFILCYTMFFYHTRIANSFALGFFFDFRFWAKIAQIEFLNFQSQTSVPSDSSSMRKTLSVEE